MKRFPTIEELMKHFMDSPIPEHIGHDSNFPRANIVDDNTQVILELGLAGWDKEDIKIDLYDDRLMVTGNSKTNHTNGGTYLRRELKRSSFTKQFVLGPNTDRAKIEAKYENGLLSITVPKLTPNKLKPVNIPIR